MKKWNTPLHVYSNWYKNQGIFEIKHDKLFDPYNFFRLGENPPLIEVENLFSKRIEKILTGK